MRPGGRMTSGDSYSGQARDSEHFINKNSQESQDTQSLSQQGTVKHYGRKSQFFTF